jgi:hypothetical protein
MLDLSWRSSYNINSAEQPSVQQLQNKLKIVFCAILSLILVKSITTLFNLGHLSHFRVIALEQWKEKFCTGVIGLK